MTKVSYCYLKKIFQLPLPQAMNQELFLCEFFLANYFFDTRHHLWNQWEKHVIIINSLISPNVSRTVLLKGYKCMSGNEKLSVRPHSLADPWSRGWHPFTLWPALGCGSVCWSELVELCSYTTSPWCLISPGPKSIYPSFSHSFSQVTLFKSLFCTS